MFKMCYAVYITMLSLKEVSDLRREVVGLVKQHREQRKELERLREHE